MQARTAGPFAVGAVDREWVHAQGAAAALSVAPATAHRWWHRWQAASEGERASLACLATRSSRPRSCPWALSAEAEQAILTAREKTNCGPMQLQFLTGRHRSTIWKVLARHGVSRRRRSERRRSSRRYEWTEAGALLHIDAFELPKFDRPGALGDRRARRAPQDPPGRQGQGDRRHRRPHPPGLLRDARRRERNTPSRPRCAAPPPWIREQGCGPVQAVMSDNAKCYATSHEFRDTLDRARRPPHPHPALHAALEREDRAVLRHPRHRMGPRPRLAQQHPTRPRPVIVHPLLQPPPTTLSRRRPTTHHPRSPSPRAGQLVLVRHPHAHAVVVLLRP